MNNRANCFKIVIEGYDTANQRSISSDDVTSYLNNNISAIQFYAFIEHKCDNKRPHYHLILKTYNEYSQTTILNDIVKELMCNRNIVSVRCSRDLVHDVRYLTHKDDFTKYQYIDDEVTVSNLMDYKDIVYKQINIYELDFESLYNICNDCKCNRVAIYSAIGLKNSKNYRYIIDDIISALKKKQIDKLNAKLYQALEKEVNE